MATPPIDPAVHKRILEMVAQGLSHREISRELGIGLGTVSEYRHKPLGDTPAQPPLESAKISESNEVSGDKWTISLPKTRICTLEQLLEHCKVDTKIWEVERFVCNKWEMGFVASTERQTYGKGNKVETMHEEREAATIPLFQVKAWLRKNRAAVAGRDLAQEFKSAVEKYKPPVFKAAPPKNSTDKDVIQELSPHDHHFGVLIWGKETDGPDCDLRTSDVCFRKAITCSIDRGRSFRPHKILLILGNDQQNADNRMGTTEAGTPQNMDSRYQKVAAVSEAASVWAIEQALSAADEVEVIIVPGNHDPLSSWHLGEYLTAWFRNNPRVKINNSPNPRKYFEFGTNMLLFTHGNKGKLEKYPGTMASEQPAMWGRTKWREAHTGDKHHRSLIELPGASVRILPSLRPSDSWSHENHYVGSIRAAESYFWHRSEGLIGTAVYSELEK